MSARHFIQRLSKLKGFHYLLKRIGVRGGCYMVRAKVVGGVVSVTAVEDTTGRIARLSDKGIAEVEAVVYAEFNRRPERAALEVYMVYGEFADGRQWPDGRLSYTHRRGLVIARDPDEALKLAVQEYGALDPEDDGASVDHVPLCRGVYGEP